MKPSRALIVMASSLLGLSITSSSASADQYIAAPSPEQVKPLTTGSRAPAFTARKPTGEVVRFEPDSLSRPVLLIFYRGGWCPYCNTHLGALRTAQSKLIAMGYDVLFLSADRPELLIPSLSEKDLPYTILSDAKMHAARAFGIAFRVDDATYERYKEWNLDLEKTSGETHHELPVPAAFILDRNGIIRFAYWNPDYKVRISPEDLLAAAAKALESE